MHFCSSSSCCSHTTVPLVCARQCFIGIFIYLFFFGRNVKQYTPNAIISRKYTANVVCSGDVAVKGKTIHLTYESHVN